MPSSASCAGSTEGDAGCTAGEAILHEYVELELAGEDPARAFPGTAIHLRSCPGCKGITTGCWKPRVASATSISADAARRRIFRAGGKTGLVAAH
jgi:hypothetical protein